jgi:hypothetical protein
MYPPESIPSHQLVAPPIPAKRHLISQNNRQKEMSGARVGGNSGAEHAKWHFLGAASSGLPSNHMGCFRSQGPPKAGPHHTAAVAERAWLVLA